MIIAKLPKGDPHWNRHLRYAVFVDGDLKYKVGPNPLTKRGAEIVAVIFERLGIDISLDSGRRRLKANDKLGIDSRLRAWCENRIPR